MPTHTNRLIDATSPYLLQHAHNPVDWYPWGDEALRRAKAEDKPILLSIGYSACHWCHVMERESFEDERIAALMNESFVCIKVDREERPDLDDIYMAATLAMNQGQGGWPMTVFLTPGQEPFFAGTYFPPEDRYGRPGFPSLLQRIAELWKGQRARLVEQGAELSDYLRRSTRPAPGASVGREELRRAAEALAEDFDERFGGFGGAPKFPPSTGLMLLLRAHRRFGDERALAMVRKTLDEMARGGMYDHLGGGFHRYSVDERWLAPHFEKMLYDQALLARAYLEGYQATGVAFYARIAREVLDYVLREMTSPQGGFYSATDADSEGEEGRFFVWTPAEVEAVLGEEDARVFSEYYDVSETGNWEGKSILNTSRTGPLVARSLGLEADALERRIAELRPRVYEARRQRVAPGLDDKVLTAWNGLMIGTMAEGARVLREPRYLGGAERAATFVLETLRAPDGRLLRTYRDGKAHLAAYLEDYAYLAEGLVELYEAGADVRFLREAERLAGLLREDFADTGGGFFSTARGHEALIVRHREGHDGAIPNASATAAHVLARLSHHLDREDLRDEAVRAIRAWGQAIARAPRAFAKSLIAVDLLLDGPIELAFVGAPGDPGGEALWREAARHYLPRRIVGHHDPASRSPADLPLLAGKTLVEGRAALYVCRGFACRRPVTDAEEVAAALGEAPAEAAGPTAERRTLPARRLPGRASAEGTRAYASRFEAGGYAPLGSSGLTVSRIGFGGYRVDDETPAHRQALERALAGGSNLVDTSTNYTGGASERLVGDVLGEAVRAGRRRREEIVVVSKIGYMQGENLLRARQREAGERPFPEVVKYADDVWHCIHPEFLDEQLGESLDRLGLETLDVCLLHNPEYFLKDAHERSYGTLERRREDFDARLVEAFRYLEAQVAAGRLGAYGVSSNTVVLPASDPEATSLTGMLAAAARAGGEGHHFRVLQLPLNLFEPGAVLERNSGAGLDQTVLEHAAAAGVAVLANRPLNAVMGRGMLRLADVPPVPAGAELDTLFHAVEGLEAEYRGDIAAQLRAGEGSAPPESFFRWGSDLRSLPDQLQGVQHWEQLRGQVILPRLIGALEALDRALVGPLAERWQSWRSRYTDALEALLQELGRRGALKSAAATDEVSSALDPLLPEPRRGETLSRKALWVLASTPGVSSVLLGMRAPEYVDDALPVPGWPPLPEPRHVYERMRELGRTLAPEN